MKISIALCTYNGERFLREQLDSIVSQTLLPDELVVCDDRSQDATLEILIAFSERSSFPVHIYQNEANLGSTKNFEKAISLCQGDIIALCDQDDVWKPQKLKRLAETLQTNPEAGYVFSNADIVDENLNPLGNHLWDSVRFTGDIREKYSSNDQFYCLTKQHVVTGATMAFRSNIGKLATPFPTRGRWIHDGWIALIASAVGAWGLPIDETLIFYRQHPNQQIGAPRQPVEDKKTSLLGMYRELKENQQALFADWEMRCIRIITLKGALQELLQSHTSSILEKNLSYLQEFEIHYSNRKEILTTSNSKRYALILQEFFSGRYTQFSDSWRSLFRDLFL